MANSTCAPLLLQNLHQVAHGVLGLSDRHAVARHDHDGTRALQQHCHFVGRCRFYAPTVHILRLRTRLGGNPHPKQHIAQRAVHRAAHNRREDDARRADQRACDDERVVVQHEACRRRRQPRIGVQQRNHHGHIRAADGNHQQQPHEGGDRQQRPVVAERRRVQHEHSAQPIAVSSSTPLM
jgi:hypothetical protein